MKDEEKTLTECVEIHGGFLTIQWDTAGEDVVFDIQNEGACVLKGTLTKDLFPGIEYVAWNALVDWVSVGGIITIAHSTNGNLTLAGTNKNWRGSVATNCGDRRIVTLLERSETLLRFIYTANTTG